MSNDPSPREPMTDVAEIRRLNDQLRQNLTGGRVLFTGSLAGQDAESIMLQHLVLASVRLSEIDPESDTYGEGDFGKIEVKGSKFFWKIDYYDATLSAGSEDPADPRKTTRVMSIFHADDY